ncbi:Transglycosylase SLT domain-containing protein [Cohaesibacter marisflavi]|uniref:Transglycosylase SLT domain-containing protein n=1 Tax=Cohaesibacter marisflavi TaxID=655353 RepID=A0A1I5C9K0_9HYPH|nr:Transglycosylase SLT domain-containing protein [Cohaesibacter marisflavi]
MKRQAKVSLIAGLLFSASVAGSAFAATARAETATVDAVCEREMRAAAASEGVPLGILYAVGLTETGRGLKLHPFALNIEGKTVMTSSKNAALDAVREARKNGKKLIDIGCMQINHHYHSDQFASLDEMIDPHANVRYAAKFLRQLRARQGSWTMAVARYHAGPDNNPAQKRYVCAVIRNLVASKFGQWTAKSRAFCDR